MTKEAFEVQVVALVETLYRVSYSLLKNPEDQADAVQEAIGKALKKRESLREERYIKTWLIRILLNECYNILRKKQREIPSEDIKAVAPPGANRELYEALMSLEEKYRLPIVLHYIEGYDLRDVAQMMRMPEGTVKTRLSRGRLKLRDLLGEEVGSNG